MPPPNNVQGNAVALVERVGGQKYPGWHPPPHLGLLSPTLPPKVPPGHGKRSPPWQKNPGGHIKVVERVRGPPKSPPWQAEEEEVVVEGVLLGEGGPQGERKSPPHSPPENIPFAEP